MATPHTSLTPHKIETPSCRLHAMSGSLEGRFFKGLAPIGLHLSVVNEVFPEVARIGSHSMRLHQNLLVPVQ